jgi:hypothetical protein
MNSNIYYIPFKNTTIIFENLSVKPMFRLSRSKREYKIIKNFQHSQFLKYYFVNSATDDTKAKLHLIIFLNIHLRTGALLA